MILSYPTSAASQYTCSGTTATLGATTTCTYTSSGAFTLSSSTTLVRPIVIQDLNYTYDANGNIATHNDNSDAARGQDVTYTYDNLNRLMHAAATTGASLYDHTFTYDAVGNILSGSAGTYSYSDSTGSSYANPDAVTQTVLTTGRSTPSIAYDNSTIAGNGTPASSLTFSHTTNNNTYGLMVVSVAEATSSPCTSDAVTGVTDNGVALTDLGYYTRNTSIGALKTYYTFNPAQGTHNIVVSASASCIRYAVAATYTGVKQNGMPNASGVGNPLSNSGAVNPFQATTNVSGINAWTVLIGVPSQSGTATAGPATTIRRQQPGALAYADSNAPVSGSSSLSWSMPSATSWLANYFSLPPLGSDPGSTSTTTYTYDHNGNLTQSTTGTTTTTYTYDYLNRLTALRTTGDSATTTYAYDWQGNRVSQTTGSTTTRYPNKYFSLTQSTTAATTHATSTLYAYANDLLLATIDTPSTTVGTTTTTGTSTTHYIHPDNLGSTQATSDAHGNLSQYFLYNPYGSVLTSTSTDPTASISRQYIGQYTDPSGLSYLNARYYASDRGQFLSQDPLFLGDPAQQNLKDPQSLNAYAYAGDNPITKSDPMGKQYYDVNAGFAAPVYGVPVGPTGGFYVLPGRNSDPIVYFGVQIANRPGPSGSVSYSPTGSPTEGFGASINGFTNRGVGVQLGASQDPNTRFGAGFGGEIGIGTPGFGASLTYSIDLYKLLALGGPFQYETTPMTANPMLANYQSPNSLNYSFTNLQSFFQNAVPQIAQARVSGSVTSSQGSALAGVVSAFSPRSSAQATAVQNVISAFTRNN